MSLSTLPLTLLLAQRSPEFSEQLCPGHADTDDRPYHFSKWWALRIDVDRILCRWETVFSGPNSQLHSTCRVVCKADPKQLAGLMITSGITVATMSAPRKKGHSTVQTHSAPSGDMSSGGDGAKYVMGVSLLAGALFLSSLLGLWQEETYKRYGKQWREGLFYSVRTPILPTLRRC